MSSQLQVHQRSFTKMRIGCATSAHMRHKHEDRPGDPNMRGHSHLDNRKTYKLSSYLNMDFDDCGRTGFDVGVQLVNGQEED